MREPAEDARSQQRAFDHFRYVYNYERPHEALGLKPPLTAYCRSPRRYPRPLESLADPYGARVDRNGFIRTI